MGSIAVTLATQNYDFVSPLLTGDVRADGVELNLIRTFNSVERVATDPTIDGGEASFSRYVHRISVGDRSVVGIPLFLLRNFRHRSFYVLRNSSLTNATQLSGKRVGTDVWAASVNVWSRAALRDRGVSVKNIQWIVGPVNAGDDAPPHGSLPSVATASPHGRCLTELLLAGDIDAIMSIWPPKGFYEDTGLRRLYLDYRSVEREYYSRTGIYPGHHLVVLRRAVVERDPMLVRSIFMAFKEARCRSDEVQWILHQGGPWQLADLEEQRALMGENFQPYGYRENRQMVAAFCEEVLAQGLIREPINPDILFAEFEEMTR